MTLLVLVAYPTCVQTSESTIALTASEHTGCHFNLASFSPIAAVVRRIFTLVMSHCVRFLRRVGVGLMAYLDDLFFAQDSESPEYHPRGRP
jgi:hypothetical protein